MSSHARRHAAIVTAGHGLTRRLRATPGSWPCAPYKRRVIDSNPLPPGSRDTVERFNGNIGFPAVAVLVAGRRGMLWVSVVEVGGAVGVFVRGRPVSWLDQTGSCRACRMSREVIG